MTTSSSTGMPAFSRYQVFMIAILTLLQFTIVLDFMVLSPLGAILLEKLHISTSQFGLVVSAYAFSAGASGLLAAGFADKFDRKKLLLFFYSGFMVGTFFCSIAPTYHFLLIARIVTGLFGGVISAVSMAIITDLFPMEVRGRVMGFVQMAFAVSQVLGIPLGLFLANHFNWHAPFVMLTVFGVLLGIVIAIYMKPVTEHLKFQRTGNAWQHLLGTVTQSRYLLVFLATTLLATGGFMLMPFASAFSIHNLGLTMEQLPMLYAITGVFSIVFGPLVGRLSDKVGKFRMFCLGTLLAMAMVAIYCNMGVTPLLLVVVVNVIMFLGVSTRIISANALISAVPSPQDRGAFMSVNASIQQLSGGIGSAVAGMIVVQRNNGPLHHYNTLGYVVIAAMIICMVLLYFINRQLRREPAKQTLAQAA
jgi:predicted MFS family arabinose efflux permease